MTAHKVERVASGMAALVLLCAIVFAVPWALWHYIGWPLPRSWPNFGEISHTVGHHRIGDQTLIKALACVIWITWSVLVASIVVEIPPALRGRSAQHFRFVGVLFKWWPS
jgi:hypothetical protein